MAKIESIEAEIALLPLLKREIRVNRVIVSAPDILVETDARGHGNLDFTPPGGEAAPPPQAVADGAPAYRFTLREVKIKNGVLAWRSPGRNESVDVHKLTVLPEQAPGGKLAVRVVGATRGRMFEITGAVGGPDSTAAGKPWPLHLKASSDGMVITAEGALADPLALHGVDLKLAAQGDELGDTAHWLGLLASAPPSMGPFKLAGHLSDTGGPLGLSDLDVAVGKRDALLVSAKGTVKDIAKLAGVEVSLSLESDNLAGLSSLAGSDIPSMGPVRLTGQLRGGGQAWKVLDLKAGLAGSELTGELALDTTRRPRLAGTLVGPNLVLTDFLTPAARPGQKPAPKTVKPAGGDGRVFSAVPLPVQALRAMDVDLALQAGKLSLGETVVSDLVAELHLANGRLAFKPFHASLGGGSLEGEASLNVAGKTPNATLRLTGRQVELGKLPGNGVLSGGKTDVRIDLKAAGESVRALMASADGEAVVSVGEGRLNNKVVDWAAGDLLNQFAAILNPLGKTEDATPLSCAVVRFTLRDGIATANKGIAMRTAKVDVVGSGTVDLRTETLDLGITPRAREGVGLSLSGPLSGLTRLRGTLANPTIGLDEEGSVRAAASVGAAVATGGLSLLGELILDRVTADSDPCRTALGQSPGKAKTRTKKRGGGLLEGLFGR